MEHKQSCDLWTLLSENYPWLVEAADDMGDHFVYTVHDPLCHYECQIPELLGRCIRGFSHGWVVLSSSQHNDVEWSLWNPVTSKLIHLPPLILKDGHTNDILHCFLSSPPDDPASILLLMRFSKRNIVFCRLDRKRKRLRWIEMSYSKQLTTITGEENSILIQPTCCNGKIYASTLGSISRRVIQVHIVVKEKEVVISLLPFVTLPYPVPTGKWDNDLSFLKGSCLELFKVIVCFMNEKPVDAYLYKLDLTSLVWTEIKDLKDTVFFVNMACDYSVSCSPPIASKLGGYIHILHKTGKIIYSYDIKGKTMAMSCVGCLDLSPGNISIWPIPGLRLQGDHGEAKCKANTKQDEMVVPSAMNDNSKRNQQNNEADLLNIPFHLLEKIMKFCVGVEYLNFRATSKRCHLAAPVIQWSNERRLQTYSSVMPWLMVFEKDCGIITFTDPMLGDNYHIKASPELFYDSRILCSRFGWLLLFIDKYRVAFFNPFTSDIRELPVLVPPDFDSFCFSAPPTSLDWMVVGISAIRASHWHVYIYLARAPSGRLVHLDLSGADSYSFRFPAFCGRDVYAISKAGGLQVFKEIDGDGTISRETVVDELPRSSRAEYFQVRCDQHLLLVIVGEFGKFVEVFKLKESTKEWVKMDGLGRHVIYICDTTCFCMDAKTPETENKIYFPRLHTKNGKLVFYSLETCRFHTSNGEENLIDLCGTKELVDVHAWIQPSWS